MTLTRQAQLTIIVSGERKEKKQASEWILHTDKFHFTEGTGSLDFIQCTSLAHTPLLHSSFHSHMDLGNKVELVLLLLCY
jgi:hypothetical protein